MNERRASWHRNVRKIRELSLKIRSGKGKKDESNALSIKSHKIIGEISNDNHINHTVSTLNAWHKIIVNRR